MCNLGEVEAALQIFLNYGVSRNMITILHCLSAYPAPHDQINLRAIHTLKNSFGCNVGYSDHSLGQTAAIAAIALGAVLIEKHITLDTSMSGPDHKASLDPIDFESMVSSIRTCERLLGSGFKYPQPSEKNTRLIARRVSGCKNNSFG